MARRSRRRRNLTPIHWGMIGVGTLIVGAGGYVTFRVIRDRRRKKALTELPPPPSRWIDAIPTPPLTMPDVEPCGPEYPGFVSDGGEGCVPSDASPAGVYVGEGCSDFVFVEGDVGPQLDYLEAVVETQAQESAEPAAQSADPTKLAADFLAEFWGECSWPPPPTAPQRIVQLYQAFAYVIGREIIAAKGRVLGTSDPDTVDEQIAERLEELGFLDFDPSIVPEIELPSAYGPPATPPDDGVSPAQISVAP